MASECKTEWPSLAEMAEYYGWRYFPNSPHADGTNALCAECQELDE